MDNPLCRILENDTTGTAHILNLDKKGEEDHVCTKGNFYGGYLPHLDF